MRVFGHERASDFCVLSASPPSLSLSLSHASTSSASLSPSPSPFAWASSAQQQQHQQRPLPLQRPPLSSLSASASSAAQSFAGGGSDFSAPPSSAPSLYRELSGAAASFVRFASGGTREPLASSSSGSEAALLMSPSSSVSSSPSAASPASPSPSLSSSLASSAPRVRHDKHRRNASEVRRRSEMKDAFSDLQHVTDCPQPGRYHVLTHAAIVVRQLQTSLQRANAQDEAVALPSVKSALTGDEQRRGQQYQQQQHQLQQLVSPDASPLSSALSLCAVLPLPCAVVEAASGALLGANDAFLHLVDCVSLPFLQHTHSLYSIAHVQSDTPQRLCQAAEDADSAQQQAHTQPQHQQPLMVKEEREASGRAASESAAAPSFFPSFPLLPSGSPNAVCTRLLHTEAASLSTLGGEVRPAHLSAVLVSPSAPPSAPRRQPAATAASVASVLLCLFSPLHTPLLPSLPQSHWAQTGQSTPSAAAAASSFPFSPSSVAPPRSSLLGLPPQLLPPAPSLSSSPMELMSMGMGMGMAAAAVQSAAPLALLPSNASPSSGALLSRPSSAWSTSYPQSAPLLGALPLPLSYPPTLSSPSHWTAMGPQGRGSGGAGFGLEALAAPPAFGLSAQSARAAASSPHPRSAGFAFPSASSPAPYDAPPHASPSPFAPQFADAASGGGAGDGAPPASSAPPSSSLASLQQSRWLLHTLAAAQPQPGIGFGPSLEQRPMINAGLLQQRQHQQQYQHGPLRYVHSTSGQSPREQHFAHGVTPPLDGALNSASFSVGHAGSFQHT